MYISAWGFQVSLYLFVSQGCSYPNLSVKSYSFLRVHRKCSNISGEEASWRCHFSQWISGMPIFLFDLVLCMHCGSNTRITGDGSPERIHLRALTTSDTHDINQHDNSLTKLAWRASTGWSFWIFAALTIILVRGKKNKRCHSVLATKVTIGKNYGKGLS